MKILQNYGDKIEFECECGGLCSITHDCGPEICERCGKRWELNIEIAPIEYDGLEDLKKKFPPGLDGVRYIGPPDHGEPVTIQDHITINEVTSKGIIGTAHSKNLMDTCRIFNPEHLLTPDDPKISLLEALLALKDIDKVHDRHMPFDVRRAKKMLLDWLDEWLMKKPTE